MMIEMKMQYYTLLDWENDDEEWLHRRVGLSNELPLKLNLSPSSRSST